MGLYKPARAIGVPSGVRALRIVPIRVSTYMFWLALAWRARCVPSRLRELRIDNGLGRVFTLGLF